MGFKINVLRDLAAHSNIMANEAETIQRFGKHISDAADLTYYADIADAIAKGKLNFKNGVIEGNIGKALNRTV